MSRRVDREAPFWLCRCGRKITEARDRCAGCGHVRWRWKKA